MNFDAAQHAQRVAFSHMRSRTPLGKAAEELISLVRGDLPEALDLSFVPASLKDSVESVGEQVRQLLTQNPPGPSITGLWFGLVEMILDPNADEGHEPEDSDDDAEQPWSLTLYVAGSTKFNRDEVDDDWPCGPEWMPQPECYLESEVLLRLSQLRPSSDDEDAFDDFWNITARLMESLNILCVGEVVRRLDPRVLLGGSPYRGIGAGLDEGDLVNLGIVLPSGFEPAESILGIDPTEN